MPHLVYILRSGPISLVPLRKAKGFLDIDIIFHKIDDMALRPLDPPSGVQVFPDGIPDECTDIFIIPAVNESLDLLLQFFTNPDTDGIIRCFNQRLQSSYIVFHFVLYIGTIL